MENRKLDYFSPLPPMRSGISDYSVEMLSELKKYFDLCAYIDEGYVAKEIGVQIEGYRKFKEGNCLLYNIGNSGYHSYLYDLALKHPGIIIMHDSSLQGLNLSMINKYWSGLRFFKELYVNYGMGAVMSYLKLLNIRPRPVVEKENPKKSKFEFGKGWHQIEEIDGIKFRWTKKNASFVIREKRLTELNLKVYADLPTELKLNVNGIKKKIKLDMNRYQWVNFDLDCVNEADVKMKISKPLSFLSKFRDSYFREMGVRVSEINYKSSGIVTNIPIFMRSEKKEIKMIKYQMSAGDINRKEEILEKYSLNKLVIKSSKGVIVHSEHLAKIVRDINPEIPVRVINHGARIVKHKYSRKVVRKRLGLDKYDFIIVSYGKIQKHKRIDVALEAP